MLLGGSDDAARHLPSRLRYLGLEAQKSEIFKFPGDKQVYHWLSVNFAHFVESSRKKRSLN